MLNDIKFSTERLRDERSDKLGIAIDVSYSIMTAVYYDFQLKRRFARASLFGVELNSDNVSENLTRLLISSMRELKIMSADVKSVGIAASFRISMELEAELTTSDLFLSPDIEIYYVPFISVDIGGRFTASLLAAPEGDDCLIADFGRMLCIAERKQGQLRCASFEMGGAFDGSGYESGMPPEKGAIDNVSSESDGTLVYEVIGDCDSIGVSPCGVAASVSVMMDNGALDSDGIMTDRDLFAIGEDFFVSQNDVRVFQADKARVAAALELFDGMERAYLSGEVFTSANGLRLLTEIGAIPKGMSSAFCRNSVEQGVIMCLESEEARQKADKIAKNSIVVTHDILEDFEKNYFGHLILEKKCEN